MKSRMTKIGVFFVFAALMTTVCLGEADSAKALDLNSSGFICDWMLCGPFPNPGKWPNLKNWDTDFLKKDGGEAKIKPTAKMSYKVDFPEYDVKDLTIKWKPFVIDKDAKDYNFVIDLETTFKINYGVTIPDRMISYAFCYIKSPKQMEVKLKIGSDDGFKAWVNGKQIASVRVKRGITPDENVISVKLKKGLNPLLLKIEEDVAAYVFMVRLTDMKDNPLTGKVKICLPALNK